MYLFEINNIQCVMLHTEEPGSYEHVAPTTSILFLFLQAATKSFAETYARRTALSMTSAIVKVVTGLLIQARDCLEDEKGFEALNSAPIITKLMPHILASISSLAASDPPSAVQVLSFIQEILPSVASLQNLYLLNQVS